MNSIANTLPPRSPLLWLTAYLALALSMIAGCSPHDATGPHSAAAFDSQGDVVSDDAAEVYIAWIDHRAVRSVTEGYQYWTIRIGIAVQMREDAEVSSFRQHDPWVNAGFTVANNMFYDPQACVRVLRGVGFLMKSAIPFNERFYPAAPPSINWTGRAHAGRVIRDDGWVVYIRPATVALGKAPTPGLYRMRLKPERWEHKPWRIDDAWQAFVITEVSGDPGTEGTGTPTEALPWIDLPGAEESAD